jgi:hypothetical protein
MGCFGVGSCIVGRDGKDFEYFWVCFQGAWTYKGNDVVKSRSVGTQVRRAHENKVTHLVFFSNIIGNDIDCILFTFI